MTDESAVDHQSTCDEFSYAQHADRDQGGSDDNIPLVFYCSKCRTIFGDSLSWECHNEDMAFITLNRINAKIRVNTNLLTSKEPPDKGSTFVTLTCLGCNTDVGRMYKSTTKGFDSIRDLYSFRIDMLESYQVGSSYEGDSEPTPSVQGGLVIQLRKMQSLMVRMNSRLCALEKLQQQQPEDKVNLLNDLDEEEVEKEAEEEDEKYTPSCGQAAPAASCGLLAADYHSALKPEHSAQMHHSSSIVGDSLQASSHKDLSSSKPSLGGFNRIPPVTPAVAQRSVAMSGKGASLDEQISVLGMGHVSRSLSAGTACGPAHRPTSSGTHHPRHKQSSHHHGGDHQAAAKDGAVPQRKRHMSPAMQSMSPDSSNTRKPYKPSHDVDMYAKGKRPKHK